MGSILTIAGVDFSQNAVGYNAPNTRGLTGLFLEGGTLAQSLRNLIIGGTSASPLHTPNVQSGYVELNMAQTIFTATVAGTVMTVTGVDFGALAVGQLVVGTGVTVGSNTTISSFGSGSGGTGTYNLSAAFTVGTAQKFSGGVGGSAGDNGGPQIITPVTDGTSQTNIMVFRKVLQPTATIDAAYGVSSAGTTVTGGAGLYCNSTGLASFVYSNVSGTVTSKGTSGLAIAYNTWVMGALVVDNVGGTIQVYNLSAGSASAPVALSGAFVPGQNAVRLGGSPVAGAGNLCGQIDIAMAETHSVALTLSELQAIYTSFKPVMQARGVSLS